MADLLERKGARPAALTGVDAFQAACLRDDEAAARAMLKADRALLANPHPLLTAAMFGNAGAVALLLKLGAPAGGLDGEGIRPLHRAGQSGANLRERKWNGTPMSWSIVLGRPNIADRLAPLSIDVAALAAGGYADRLKAVLDEDPAPARQVFGRNEERPTALFCLPDDEAAAPETGRTWR